MTEFEKETSGAVRLPPEIEKLLQPIAERLAQKKVDALTMANGMVFTEIFRVLLSKGVLANGELARTLTQFETDAASKKAEHPTAADALGLITLILQRELLPRSESSN